MSESSTQIPPAPSPQGDGEKWVVSLDPARLLPAFCPLCSAPGTSPRTVKQARTLTGSPLHLPLEAHYCDTCAQNLQDDVTRRIALLATTTLLSMASLTGAALYWGTRSIGLQLFVGLGCALGPPWLLKTLGWFPKENSGLVELGGSPSTRKLEIHHSTYLKRLKSDGLLQEPALRSDHRTGWLTQPELLPILLIAVLCATWWLAIHTLGNAKLRVIKSGDQSGILLVDDRNVGRILATNSEDARAGRFISVLGGRRSLQLVSDDGTTEVSTPLLVWPNHTYIVGTLPAGNCLYWEEQKSGSAGTGTQWIPLGGSGPIWETDKRVDIWFAPLSPQRKSASKEDPLPLSGGIRRAIRLLPCR